MGKSRGRRRQVLINGEFRHVLLRHVTRLGTELQMNSTKLARVYDRDHEVPAVQYYVHLPESEFHMSR